MHREVPVKGLAVHDLDQHDAHHRARGEADDRAQRAGGRAFQRKEPQHVAPAQSQETQNAEFAPA